MNLRHLKTEADQDGSPARKKFDDKPEFKVLRSKIMPTPHFKEYSKLKKARGIRIDLRGTITPTARATSSHYRPKRATYYNVTPMPLNNPLHC